MIKSLFSLTSRAGSASPTCRSRRPFARFLRGLSLAATLPLVGAVSVSAAEFPVTLAEGPAGSGFFTAVVSDTFTANGAAGGDDWRIDAETGDRVTAVLESPLGATSLRVQLVSPGGTSLQQNTSDGRARLQDFVITAPGSYRVRVSTDTTVTAANAPYALRLELARGAGLEREANDNAATATGITPVLGAGQFHVRAGGTLDRLDPADHVVLGRLLPGGNVAATFAPGAASALALGQIRLELVRLSDALPVATATAGSLDAPVTIADDYVLRVAPVSLATTALRFTGAEVVSVPLFTLDGADALTAEGFLRTTHAGPQTLLSAGNAANPNELVVELLNATQVRVSTGEGTATATFNTPTLNDGQWHHLALVRKGPGGGLQLFIDGVARGTSNPALNALTLAGGSVLLGQRRAADGTFTADQGFQGDLDHVRLWRVAKTADQIARYSEPALDTSVAALSAAYDFDATSGTIATDRSTHAAHATLGTGAAGTTPAWVVSAAPVYQRGLDATYFIAATVSDTIAPSVESTTLPAQGTTSTDILEVFSVTFTEDMNAAAVNNPANYELRGAGANGTFGDADDILYAFASATYTTGRTVALVLAQPPVQPGLVRFRADVGLADRAGNPFAAAFTRTFTIARLENFVFETQHNDTGATATSLSLQATRGGHDGTFVADATSFGTIGGDTYSVQSGDLDGDGRPDVVVANFSANTVHVFRQTAGAPGTFAAPVSYTVGAQPAGLALVDLDGDNDLDLAVANYGSASVSILRNQGNGTFAPRTDYATATQARFLVAGDFNGDGRPDLAVSHHSAAQVHVLFNQPAAPGTFTVGPALALPGTSPARLVTGDFDQDGDLDLALTLHTTNKLALLRNGGTGVFTADPLLDSAADAYGLAAGDVDGDGRLDLVVGGTNNTPLHFHRGLAAGAFAAPVTFGPSGAYYDIALRQLVGTATPEIFAARGDRLIVAERLATGSFGMNAFPVESTARALAVADFDLDGHLDAVVTRSNGQLRLLRGRGEETLLVDPAASELRHAFGRGTINHADDVDVFSFSARAGDRLTITFDITTPGSARRHTVRVHSADGTSILHVNSEGTGEAQFGGIVLPASGRYTVSVSPVDHHRGEYRFRLSLAPAPWNTETEDNNTHPNADFLDWQLRAGGREARLLGTLGRTDTADIFRLGHLAPATQVQLSLARPSFSALVGDLALLDASGAVIASAPAATTLSHPISAAQAGQIYARVTGVPAAFNSQYHLTLTLGDTTGPVILSTPGLPAEGSSSDAIVDRFTVTLSEDLLAPTVNDLAHYSLVELGSGATYTLAPTEAYVRGPTFELRVTDGPLQPGNYRLTIGTGLRDLSNNPLAAPFVRQFTVLAVPGWTLENRSNDTRATATPLPVVAEAGAAGWRAAQARGHLDLWSDVDHFAFEVPAAGTPAILVVDLPSHTSSTYLAYTITNAAGTHVASTTGAQVGFTFPTAGTYYLAVARHNTFLREYRARLVFAPAGWQSEQEDNHTTAAANIPALTLASGARTAQVFGSLQRDDTADLFRLGNLDAGTVLQLELTRLPSSALTATLEVLNSAGTAVAIAPAGTPALSYPIPAAASGTYFVRVAGTPRDLASFYRLALSVGDPSAPTITASTLPAEGAELGQLLDRFTLTFSEDMRASTVNASSSYELRHAGADDTFGTADDALYTVAPLDLYTVGLTASLRVTDGPLQPGRVRFTATTALADLAGNALASAFTRTWRMGVVAGYVLENRDNNTLATATSLSTAAPGAFDGTFLAPEDLFAIGNSYGVRSADLDGDGDLDLVVTDTTADVVKVYLNSGDATFTLQASYATPADPFTVVIADFDGQHGPDLAVSSHSTTQLAVLLSTGGGSFAPATLYPVANGARYLAAAHLDSDSYLDLVTTGYEGNAFAILRGQAGGTFAPAEITARAGEGPHGVAVGDLDGDARPDLVFANYRNHTVTLFRGQADGSFVFGGALPAGSSPATVALADLDGDLRLDAVVGSISTNGLRRFRVTPAGDFVEAGTVGTNQSATHELHLPDLDGDGVADLLVARNTELYTALGTGAATFQDAVSYATPGNTRSVTWGDFDGDGRVDLISTNQATSGAQVRLHRGRAARPLAGDPAASGFFHGAGRGQLDAGTDVDLYTFSARAGQRVIIAAEYHSLSTSSLSFALTRLDSTSNLVHFYSSSGQSQSDPVTLPYTGTYVVKIGQHDGYRGEYRFRVLLFPAPWQGEIENNNTLTTAQVPAFTLVEPGLRRAQLFGYIRGNDAADHFALGNLSPGTVIRLSATRPASSALNATLELRRANNSIAAAAPAAGAPLTFTVPAAGAGAYTARIDGTPASFFSFYQLTLETSDTFAPAITAADVAGERGDLFHLIGLTFSEDMLAATVNAATSYELRSAGANGVFEAAGGDDVIVPLVGNSNYTTGLTHTLRSTTGVLQPGLYRFTAKTDLQDTSGNALAAPFVRDFAVTQVPGFITEQEDNDTAATATLLPLTQSQPGLLSGGARGNRATNGGTDFFCFEAQAGDLVVIAAETVATSSASLDYHLFAPNGTTALGSFRAASDGRGQTNGLTLTTTGTHYVRVTSGGNSHTGEYRFRVSVYRGVAVETEANNSLATADVLGLVTAGQTQTGTVAGYVASPADLDYVDLGNLPAGVTVFLSARRPAASTLLPVVSLYRYVDATTPGGLLLPESGAGRPFDGVAEIAITTPGRHYALVRGGALTGGLLAEYLLDVLIVPSAGGQSYANLQIATLTPPEVTGIKSGDNVMVSYRVQNAGTATTGIATWFDRVVLSVNEVAGDADDVPVATLQHTGALASGAGYNTAVAVKIPDGVAGDFFVIVQTDVTNVVNEFIFEADNQAASEEPITITLASYADVVLESVALSAPNQAGARTLTWTTANRGTAATSAVVRELVRVVPTGSATAVFVAERALPANLVVNATSPGTVTFTVTTPGSYVVEITTDADDSVFEYSTGGHRAAELNTAVTGFSIVRRFQIDVAAAPASGGTVSGGGSYVEGTPVTATATVDTSVAPWAFVSWNEGPFLRSTSPIYTFTPASDRSLTAIFRLPAYAITATATPATGGKVTGAGTMTHGDLVTLTATANPGYTFAGWRESGVIVSPASPFNFNATQARTFAAVFNELTPAHTVTTATAPAGLATVLGAGSFANGQATTITAPATVTQGNNEFLFERLTLNGQPLSTTPSVTKTLGVLDPATLAYVAEYRQRSYKPVIVAASASRTGTLGTAHDVKLTVRFDRSMDATVAPALVLAGAASTAPVVPVTGTWSTTTLTADTFTTDAFRFVAGNDGTFQLGASAARDAQSRVMAPAAGLLTLVVDATAPARPAFTTEALSLTSLRFDWAGYSAPADLASFRLYREAHPFSTIAGLSPASSILGSFRTLTLTGLTPDVTTHVALVAVDQAGNAVLTGPSIPVAITSDVPPAVTPVLSRPALATAQLDWTFEDEELIGFDGFRVYHSTTPFISVAGLTPETTLTPSARRYTAANLDRTQDHYFAIVPVNRLGQFAPTLAVIEWTDPLAGTLTENFTAGGPGEESILIYDDLVVASGVQLTLRPGTTLRFTPGTGFVIEGALVAEGTALQPIHFTSSREAAGNAALGDWDGMRVTGNASASKLRHTWLRYGKGVEFTSGSPALEALRLVYNTTGLHLSGTATATTNGALVLFNTTGVRTSQTGALTLTGSVLRGNSTAAQRTAGTLSARQNWWGTTNAGAIAGMISGVVDTAQPLASEPVLAPAVATVDAATQTGAATVQLRLAAPNATAYRVSEDAAFTSVPFTDLPASGQNASLFAAYPFEVPFALSNGGGTKTIRAQFLGVGGVVSPTVTFTLTRVTGGPLISAFNLTEGQLLTRPFVVEGVATAPLGVASMEFAVAGTPVLASPASPLTGLWDIRSLTPGLYRVRLSATDTAGRLTTQELNVTVAPVPPPAPVITLPADGSLQSAATVNVAGTAERGLALVLTRNNVVQGNATADAAGNFLFAAVPLVEGDNVLLVTGADTLGSTASQAVRVIRDSGAPSAAVLSPVARTPEGRLVLDWRYGATGERPTRFRVLWAATPFTTPAQATGQSELFSTLEAVLLLADGAYHFAVVGFDDAGNTSPLSNLQSFTLDTTAPTFAFTFSRSTPIGPGPLTLTVTSSEPLQAAPSITVKPAGFTTPVAVTLTSVNPTTWTADYPVNQLSAATGTAVVRVSGRDLSGNVFQGEPAGLPLVFDVTRPTGAIVVDRSSPVQVLTPQTLAVTLTLTKDAATGSMPALSFAPPSGASVPVALTGSGAVWSGSLPLTSAMGSGLGSFVLSVTDALGNTGTAITSGASLELYNTAQPSAPAVPAALVPESFAGGRIKVKWNASPLAHSYRLYRAAGQGSTAPTELLQSGITATEFEDLPPADGVWRYAVTAFRLGSESAPSGVMNALSDRTPPGAPVNFAAQLTPAGVRLTFAAPEGQQPAKYNLYRNGTYVRSTSFAAPLVDAGPRGVLTYALAAADPLGNESARPTATVELFVGAVDALDVIVDSEGVAALAWEVTDPAAVGVNVYRDGLRRNASPVTTGVFADSQGLSSGSVLYGVRPVDSQGREGPERSVRVHPLTIDLSYNVDENGADRPLRSRYFDRYTAVVTNAAAEPFAWSGLTFRRTPAAGGETVEFGETFAPAVTIDPKASAAREVVFPGVTDPSQAHQFVAVITQDTQDTAVHVTYLQQQLNTLLEAPSVMLSLATDVPPLAGGANAIKVRIYNQGFADLDVVLTRENGARPGDLSIAVLDGAGEELSRTWFQGTVPGITFLPDGRGIITVAPKQFREVVVPAVLVPESLGATRQATFRATINPILHATGTSRQRSSGPLEGTMNSSLVESAYYGTAQTDKSDYANDEVITITGQARDRVTGQPVPNVALKLGFAARGFRWTEDATTDAAGNYTFAHAPIPGFAGRIALWASHPAVVDQLDQASVLVRRLIVTPQFGEIRMSKGDVLDFDLTALNPGEDNLGTPALAARVFRVVNGVEVTEPSITATFANAPDAELLPGQRRPLRLRLQAATDAPDSARVELTFTTPQSARGRFTGDLTLSAAVPILSVISPTAGYVETSMDRGRLVSRQVTVANRGLKKLEDLEIVAPTGLPWIAVNLPTDDAGKIHLGDLAVGEQATFTVVFAPPADAPLGLYDDFLVLRGSNTLADYRLNLFAQLTSDLTGAAHFAVDSTLVLPVPGAAIHLRNTALRLEAGPFYTDAAGQVTVPDLQEGNWSFRVTAPGHNGASGVVEVVPDQTTDASVRLYRNVVTVNFNVVPVPFTDRYEIRIEQTFETRVPAPVIVMSPPKYEFSQVKPGFEATIIYTLRNEGLIALRNVELRGTTYAWGGLTPLVEFIPELKAQESINVPYRIFYSGQSKAPAGSLRAANTLGFDASFAAAAAPPTPNDLAQCVLDVANLPDTDGAFLQGLAAIAKGGFNCADGPSATTAATALAVLQSYAAVGTMVGSKNLVGSLVSFAACIGGKYLPAIPIQSLGGAGNSGWAATGSQGNGNGSSGCFLPGTSVLLADGTTKPIEAIVEGDRVRSGVETNAVATVVTALERESDRVLALTVAAAANSADAARTINVTADHRVWLDGKGWTLAGDVRAGDWLHDARGRLVEVRTITAIPGTHTVHTLQLSGDSAFYAGGILVEDLCGGLYLDAATSKEGTR